MSNEINWPEAIQPLLKKYKGSKHPLEFKSVYELMVMVVLSAQVSDKLINSLAPKLFKAYPTMQSLSHATAEDLLPYVNKIRNFANKTSWLLDMAKQIKNDKNIPNTMEGLTALPGIGRKSANVIMREMKVPREGIIIDLHTLRVANRIGISDDSNPIAMEKKMMKMIPQKDWEVGMALSFLGREVCRPTNPNHEVCVMKNVCEFCKQTY
jgi:endonuclease-3